MEFIFEWDEAKNAQNIKKHGISFEEAQNLWKDFYIDLNNLAHVKNSEFRSATLGQYKGKVYLAVWTARKEKIRLISVRRARKYEEKAYQQKIQNS